MKSSEMNSSAVSFRRILLATDFGVASQAAFTAAANLCHEFGARLFILHVFEYGDPSLAAAGTTLPDLKRLYAEAQRSLNDCLEKAKQAGLSVEITMKFDAPAVAILNTIETKDIDLAVLGTNALHGFERMVFGSTAEKVLRSASCPVLTIGPHSRNAVHLSSPENPVVFATDFHSTTTNAIRYAEPFCESSGTHLHCIHVVPRSLETDSQGKIIPTVVTEALRHLAQCGAPSIDEPVIAVLSGSEVSNAVVDYASQHHARLIVLGVRKASMLAAHGPMHIPFRIISEASCPVLTIASPARRRPTLMAACVAEDNVCMVH
jgi:nucleotide-binding universal stress UspA family protein